jgi:hypothetical protein
VMIASELMEGGKGKISDIVKGVRNYSSLPRQRVRCRRVRGKRRTSISKAGEGRLALDDVG